MNSAYRRHKRREKSKEVASCFAVSIPLIYFFHKRADNIIAIKINNDDKTDDVMSKPTKISEIIIESEVESKNL